MGLALGLTAVLLVASALRPDPAGLGTHRQLGLPRCAFLEVTGLPCPSCGMTTAFAWTVRGRLDRAWMANPAGLALCLACAAFVPWAAACAATGRTWWVRSLDDLVIGGTLIGLGLALASWAIRVFVGRLSG